MVDALIGEIPGMSAYIDDIVVDTKDLESPDTALRAVREQLKKYRISDGRISPSPGRAEAIKRLKKHSNDKEMRSFLGMTNDDRYANHEAVLRRTIKAWHWSEETEAAYQRLVEE